MFISMMENINVRKTPVEHVDGFIKETIDGFIKETIYLLICLFLFIHKKYNFFLSFLETTTIFFGRHREFIL
jgi:hypothetical protein